jgi:hypothetical protein
VSRPKNFREKINRSSFILNSVQRQLIWESFWLECHQREHICENILIPLFPNVFISLEIALGWSHSWLCDLRRYRQTRESIRIYGAEFPEGPKFKQLGNVKCLTRRANLNLHEIFETNSAMSTGEASNCERLFNMVCFIYDNDQSLGRVSDQEVSRKLQSSSVEMPNWMEADRALSISVVCNDTFLIVIQLNSGRTDRPTSQTPNHEHLEISGREYIYTSVFDGKQSTISHLIFKYPTGLDLLPHAQEGPFIVQLFRQVQKEFSSPYLHGHRDNARTLTTLDLVHNFWK